MVQVHLKCNSRARECETFTCTWKSLDLIKWSFGRHLWSLESAKRQKSLLVQGQSFCKIQNSRCSHCYLKVLNFDNPDIINHVFHISRSGNSHIKWVIFFEESVNAWISLHFLENRCKSFVSWWVSGGLVGSLSLRDLDRIRTNRSEHHVSLAEN